jgi:hypothetical protein
VSKPQFTTHLQSRTQILSTGYNNQKIISLYFPTPLKIITISTLSESTKNFTPKVKCHLVDVLMALAHMMPWTSKPFTALFVIENGSMCENFITAGFSFPPALNIIYYNSTFRKPLNGVVL